MKQIPFPAVDEVLYRRVLPNGLTVAVVPRKDFSKKSAYFATNFGSIHTEFTYQGQEYTVPAGIAHYLEHKMFDLPGGRDVSAEFAAYGASTNAFTSYDITAYYFSCTEHFDDCLRLLLEFVSTPYFTDESVEKERGIIDQEIGMNRDNADTAVFENLMQALYRLHPVKVPILGTEETIRQITPENLTLCHNAFYHPENMLLCVVGDVDPEAVAAIAEEMLPPATTHMGIKHNRWPEPMTALTDCAETRMEVAMATFELGFKCEPPQLGAEGIRQEMIADLAAEALFGESSPLYLRLYEQGLIDSSFGGGFETLDGCAFFLCGGDSEQPFLVKDAILEQAAHLQTAGISDEDFLRMKRSALGRRIRDLDSFDGTCYRICAYHFSDFDYFRFPEIYQQVQKEDLLAFLKKMVSPERSALSIVFPVEK